MKKIQAVIDRKNEKWVTIVPVYSEDEVHIPLDWIPGDASLNSVVDIHIVCDKEKQRELEDEIFSLRKNIESNETKRK